MDFGKIDFLFLEILNGKFKFVIGVIYRPPDAKLDETEKFLRLINSLAGLNEYLMVVGDFNLDYLKFKSKFVLLEDAGLQLVNCECPSHFWPNAIPTLIDLAFSNCMSRIKRFGHCMLMPVTHHECLFFSFQGKYVCNKRFYEFSYRNYRDIDFARIERLSSCIQWDNFYLMNDLDQMVEFFNRHFNWLHDECVPLKKVKLKFRPQRWFNDRVRNVLRERKEAYDSWKNCRMSDNVAATRVVYDGKCREAKKIIRFEKRRVFIKSYGLVNSVGGKWALLDKLGCKERNDSANDAGSIGDSFCVDDLNDFFISLHSSSLLDLPERNNH